MGARVLVLSAILAGYATLAFAVPQQAQEPTSVPQDVAASSASDSSKQASDQSTAGPQAQKKDEKTLHKIHVRLGLVSVGLGYTHFSGPYYYPYFAYNYYPYSYPYGVAYVTFLCDPFWCAYPFALSPVYSGSLLYAEDKGEVKLTADPKTAEVYIDGAYAGKADRLKTMWLDSGAYDLSLSANGRAAFHQRIYVLSRKSLGISAKLEPEKTPDAARHEKEVKP